MPEPKPALPTQPGMAGGGLTSIPLDFDHDFAAGGIIAFASGGEPDPYALPETVTEAQAKDRREKAQQERGFGGDPYEEAKRRYSDLEKRQLEREKEAGADRFWAGLSTFAGSGTKGFGESMGMAMKTAQDLENKQRSEGDTQRTKMAELHSLWGKEQDALKRADYAADMGQVDKANALRAEALKLRQTRDQIEAQKTTAAANAKQAETAAARETREAEAQKLELPAKIKVWNSEAARNGRPPASVEEVQRYIADPKYAAAYDKMQSIRNGGKGEFTREDAMKLAFPGGVMPGMDPQDGINAANKIFDAVNRAKNNPSNPYSTASNDQIKAELAKLGIK